jgi:uncharacterized protein YceH (UPF0502 family)
MAASLTMPPRDRCPGCHSAIYSEAREQGWCTDCKPPEIEVLRRQLGRRKFSAVLSNAVAAAVGAHKDAPDWTEEDLNRDQWFAMYQAQCSATDQFKKRADAKSDAALTARIAELEQQIAKLNHRIARLNDAADTAKAVLS